MGFKAEPELREQIERLARAQDRSQSWVIRGLLLRALAANEKTA
jgi:predicted transcriptional regulator